MTATCSHTGHSDLLKWPFWIDTHITGPLKKSLNGLAARDRYGETCAFYNDVAGILCACKEKGIVLGVASRTSAPELARSLLSLLAIPETADSAASNAISMFDHMEIYPGSKTAHFQKLHKKAKLPYEEMLFFDDESRNKNVEQLGVVMCLVRDGVSVKEIDRGIGEWRQRNGRTSSPATTP